VHQGDVLVRLDGLQAQVALKQAYLDNARQQIVAPVPGLAAMRSTQPGSRFAPRLRCWLSCRWIILGRGQHSGKRAGWCAAGTAGGDRITSLGITG
jgi:hypothetical protein